MQVNKEFDIWAGTYTKIMEDFVPNYRKMLTGIVDYLPVDFQPKRILDLGCGNGNATAILLSRFPDAAYTLLDVSAEMRKACEERFKDNSIHFVEAYIQDANFDVGTFDLIVATLSIHHLNSEEKQRLFVQLPVWLNKNGIFVYSDLMIDHQNKSLHDPFLKRWEAFARSNGRTDEDWNWMADHHAKYDKPDDVNEQMKWLIQAGFNDVTQPWSEDYWTCLIGGLS